MDTRSYTPFQRCSLFRCVLSVIVAVEVSSVTPFVEKPVEAVAIGGATVEMVSQGVRGGV